MLSKSLWRGWGLSVSLLELWKVSRSYLFLNFWANGEINCIKNIQSINSLVHITFVSCNDCPRSVCGCSLCGSVFGVALVLLYCLAVALWLCYQYCMILGDRSKNSLIALKDRNPNSRKKRGQTKSTKNNQFCKITQRMCCFPCRVSCWKYLIFLGKRLYIFWAFYTSDNSHYVKWVLI